MTQSMYLPMFYLRQRFAMTTNRYELYAANPDGSYGQLMALAEQKRMAFKEQVTFYSDDTQDAAGLRVQGAQGDRPRLRLRRHRRGRPADRLLPQGLRREPAALDLPHRGPGYQGTGQERSQGVALVRRFMDIPFLPIHFDFVDTAGHPLLASSGRGASATSTPCTCPTSGSTSGSRRRSRSPSTP